MKAEELDQLLWDATKKTRERRAYFISMTPPEYRNRKLDTNESCVERTMRRTIESPILDHELIMSCLDETEEQVKERCTIMGTFCTGLYRCVDISRGMQLILWTELVMDHREVEMDYGTEEANRRYPQVADLKRRFYARRTYAEVVKAGL